MSANELFCSLKSISIANVEGRPVLDILTLPLAQVEHFQSLLKDAAMGRPSSTLLGIDSPEESMDYIKILPLSDTLNRITHILIVTVTIPPISKRSA